MPGSNLAEYRHMRSGSLNIPSQSGHSDDMMSPMAGAQRFEGPRSPPNTAHVPCKFFRQGACQAGNACPFSHDLGSASENVCKYFAKGNCKFGPKCANIHVLPDGRRINYGKNGVTIGVAPINLGSRVNPSTYHQSSNSALTNSFMRGDNGPHYNATSPFAIQGEDRYGGRLGRQPSMENGLPTIDTTYSSNPTSVYGSPRDDDASRFGLGLSPVNTKGLSVLDAPLPASFDSNGISHAARYGPWPSSVPSKFGLDSPSPSLNSAKDARTSETLKLLHTSAFGSSEHLSVSGGLGGIGSDLNGFNMGSSPPTSSGQYSGTGFPSSGSGGFGGEEYFGKRAMHSSSLRYAKPRLLSSSAPKVDRDWEPEFLFEEDYVPGALANEVLTPAEKARRGSNTTLRLSDGALPGDELSSSPAPVTMFGSPATAVAASPSRWGPLFQRQKEEEGFSLDGGGGSFSSRSAKASAFGHVGSPLRNSSLASNLEQHHQAHRHQLSNGSAPAARPGSGSRSGSGSESLSVLTQQLQRTRLAGEPDSIGNLHPHGSATAVRTASGDRDRPLERHISSSSIGSVAAAARFTAPIDEEDPAFVFSMEEEDEATAAARKRFSGPGPGAAGGGTTSVWSYAAAAAGASSAAGGGGGGKGPAGGSAGAGGSAVETR